MKFRRMSFVLCMLLFLVSGICAYAKQCELRISLGEKGSEIELFVYKAAELENGEYVWLQEFEGVDVELVQARSAEETKTVAEKLYAWSVENNIQPGQKGTTDENGVVSFNVGTGVYVIVEETEKGSMAPVLLMMPEHVETHMDLSPKFRIVDPEDTPDGPENPDNPGEPKEEKTDDKVSAPRTGDTANVVLWVSVLAVALIGIAVVVKKNHKGKKKRKRR